MGPEAPGGRQSPTQAIREALPRPIGPRIWRTPYVGGKPGQSTVSWTHLTNKHCHPLPGGLAQSSLLSPRHIIDTMAAYAACVPPVARDGSGGDADT